MKRFFLLIVAILLLLPGCGQQNVPAAAPTPTAAPTAAPTPAPTPVKTTPPAPTPTPVPELQTATVVVAGDLMCLSAQIAAAHSKGGYSFENSFALIADKISEADLAIGNLETLVSKSHPYSKSSGGDEAEAGDAAEAPVEAPPAPAEGGDAAAAPAPTKRPNPRINAPEPFLAALAGSGFDVLTMANNHIFDYGADGLAETLEKVDEYGFAHTGACMAEEDRGPLVVEAGGIHIGVCAYTNVLNHKPGKAYMVNRFSEERVASDIAAARENGADFVIVYIHWGTEHTHKPNRAQRKMAEQIAQAGADIIFGSHPHCTQPFEVIETERGDVPVLYSLGNFVSSMGKPMHKDGVLVHLTLEKDPAGGETKLTALAYTPTYCASSLGGGRFVVCPADLQSIAGSEIAGTLESSRERTVKVLTENVAAAH